MAILLESGEDNVEEPESKEAVSGDLLARVRATQLAATNRGITTRERKTKASMTLFGAFGAIHLKLVLYPFDFQPCAGFRVPCLNENIASLLFGFPFFSLTLWRIPFPQVEKHHTVRRR